MARAAARLATGPVAKSLIAIFRASEAAKKLKGVVAKLEEAAFHNLDQLEALNRQIQADEEVCDRVLDGLRRSQQALGELKQAHPDRETELSGVQEQLGDQIGAGVMMLKAKIHENSEVFLSLIANQLSADYLKTEHFARRPLAWLDLISRNEGHSLSYSPTFGYDICARRISSQSSVAERFDLSRWRLAGNGADMIRPDVMQSFVDAFADDGEAGVARS